MKSPRVAATGERYRPDLEPWLTSQVLRKVPRSKWLMALARQDVVVLEVWLSARFLVQVYARDGARGVRRVSVARVERSLERPGAFEGGITWDDLQAVKSAVGFAERDAVEVFPCDADVVNVANMRHLWILDERLSFVWRG